LHSQTKYRSGRLLGWWSLCTHVWD
jgi:hypothetical protein